MATPRNNLQYHYNGKYENTVCDTLYEIVDVELSSRKDIYDMWENLKRTHKEFRKTFARKIYWDVIVIANKNKLYPTQHMAEVICRQIAQDWWDNDDSLSKRK
jgi:hypothetical protein